MKHWVFVMGLCVALLAQAEDKSPEAAANKVVYVSLHPPLIGNYGAGPTLQYYKADVALQVTGDDNASKVKYHEPLIRNQLITLFSQQTDESLSTVDAKEALRQQALKQVQQVLTQEEGKPLVDDLLFNNLIVQ